MNEETLFHEALARTTPQERAAFLAAACAGRPELRSAVEALLAAHEQPGRFLSQQGIAISSGTGPSTPVSAPPANETDFPLTRDTENRPRATDPERPAAGPATVDFDAAKVSLAATPETPLPTQIGRYVIRGLLGRGANGLCLPRARPGTGSTRRAEGSETGWSGGRGAFPPRSTSCCRRNPSQPVSGFRCWPGRRHALSGHGLRSGTDAHPNA